ncbi:hypothetical protein NPIL_510101 [Nephila pilipes]|uniref:Uncharacterized protein n=1 Tax=Nephila pilipes TaxID=299642 RepID=A0A8X6KKF2_NEPPI|nr:hypothetical protein NPIL_510101 [Nephila pilipes]
MFAIRAKVVFSESKRTHKQVNPYLSIIDKSILHFRFGKLIIVGLTPGIIHKVLFFKTSCSICGPFPARAKRNPIKEGSLRDVNSPREKESDKFIRPSLIFVIFNMAVEKPVEEQGVYVLPPASAYRPSNTPATYGFFFVTGFGAIPIPIPQSI